MVFERLGAAGKLEANSDPLRQLAIRTATNVLRDAGITDPGDRVVVLGADNLPVFSDEQILAAQKRANLLRESYAGIFPVSEEVDMRLLDDPSSYSVKIGELQACYIENKGKLDKTSITESVLLIRDREREYVSKIEFSEEENISIDKSGLSSRIITALSRRSFPSSNSYFGNNRTEVPSDFAEIVYGVYGQPNFAPVEIRNLGTLSMYTAEEILTIRQVSQGGRDEIINCLAKHGLVLANPNSA